jgi:predicted RNA binding protein YcfA (HicA-like mRNA interferase family)
VKLPRDCSESELIKVLCREFEYVQNNQEGSHVILQTNAPRNHRLSVPNHPSLRPGTLNAILRVVAQAKGLEKTDLLDHL